MHYVLFKLKLFFFLNLIIFRLSKGVLFIQ